MKDVKAKVAESLASGKGVIETAQDLGLHRNTVSHHKKDVGSDIRLRFKDAVDEYRADVVLKLAEIEALVADPSVDRVDKAKVLLDVVKQLRAIHGTDAPTRSVTARIDASATGVQYEFLEHSHGLTRPQLDDVFRFMDSLPRQRADIDLSGFENGGNDDAA